MSWFLVILFLSLTYGSLSEANHDNKKLLPSAVVVGTVYCDTCFQQAFSKGSHFISGASVEVECKDGNSRPRFKKEVKTDEHGEFKVQLPFSVGKHVRRIKGCIFKLLSSSEPYCAVASAAATSSLSLKKRMQGEHIFSAGLFSFKPIKKPNLCNQKQSIPNSKVHGYVKNEFPPNINPSFPQVPGKTKRFNPTKSSDKSQFSDKIVPDPEDLLFPPLIPNPFQPPLIPNPFQPPPLIPNPFQPPSPPLIPNPFQPPSPPPFIPNPFQPPSPPPLIPNPFQPPPSKPPPLFPFPPIVIPGLTPSPPPPPPPVFPFPFPPLFPPLFPPPRSPGSPPTSSP